MNRNVRVELGSRSYEIDIGEGILGNIGATCAPLAGKGMVLVVTDSNVREWYLEPCLESLRSAGLHVARSVVPAGEASKSQDHLFGLYGEALEHGLDRHALVVALGGGVIGDLAGFMAATLYRGIRFVQVPTTLLAMVDSSVGGKTAINLSQGKNLVGAFYQPQHVLADLSTLSTLPDREYRAGLAEVVKYGAIMDRAFFEYLEQHAEDLLARDHEVLGTVVERCCACKAEIVNRDEREGGLRAILNLGHTAGHAWERLGGYREYLHGEAVAAGMMLAARLSCRATGLPEEDAERLKGLLQTLGLPVELKVPDCDEFMAIMKHDKKAREGLPRFVLLESLGRAKLDCAVPGEQLREVLPC